MLSVFRDHEKSSDVKLHKVGYSAATYLRCGELCRMQRIGNFMLSLAIKKFENRLRFYKVRAKKRRSRFWPMRL